MYYDVTLWGGRVIIVAVKTQQCILCVLFHYMPLCSECRTLFRWQIYVAGNNEARVSSCTVQCPTLHSKKCPSDYGLLQKHNFARQIAMTDKPRRCVTISFYVLPCSILRDQVE